MKLLRVLQDRKVRPVGGRHEVEVDIRVVAATNRDMEADVEAGLFRRDLFYRLNVIRLHLPPLRDRVQDIPLLASHLVEKHCALAGRGRLEISEEAKRWLVEQPYPGNVRELENVVERAVTLARTDQITLEDLPHGMDEPVDDPGTIELGEGFDIDDYLGQIEKRVLIRALEQAGGVRTEAAKLLGTTFRSLRYRLAKYAIGDSDGK